MTSDSFRAKNQSQRWKSQSKSILGLLVKPLSKTLFGNRNIILKCDAANNHPKLHHGEVSARTSPLASSKWNPRSLFCRQIPPSFRYKVMRVRPETWVSLYCVSRDRHNCAAWDKVIVNHQTLWRRYSR